MKQTTISVNVYEVGDVVEINRGAINLVAKQRSIGESRRAIVIDVMQRKDKLFTYKMVAANGKPFTLTPNEQGEEKYVGHIDMALLFEGA